MDPEILLNETHSSGLKKICSIHTNEPPYSELFAGSYNPIQTKKTSQLGYVFRFHNFQIKNCQQIVGI